MTQPEFETPSSVEKASPGGVWDGQPADSSEQPPDAENLENEAWRYDADQADRDAATDVDDEVVDEENQEVEAEQEVAEPETVVEEQAVEAPSSEEEEEAALSPRANERIRQLVEEKNTERSRVSQLESKLEAMLALQERQMVLQEQAQQARVQQAQAAQRAQQQKAFENQLKQYGFREDDVSHVLALQALEAARDAKATAESDKAARINSQQQTAYRAYESALVTELDKSLSDSEGKLIVDENVRESLYRAAYAIARDEQLADPSEAVKKAVAPFLKHIKPVSKPSKRPSAQDPVHKTISAQGRAAGKASGTRASGKAPLARDVQAFLK